VAFDERFVAMLLCWEKGQGSPIHDHAGSSCWVKVLSGELLEVLYESPGSGGGGTGGATGGGRMQVKSTSKVKASARGDCCDMSYMNDTKGVHSIRNMSCTEVAVSLHIYAPPFRQCNIFVDTSGEPRPVSMVPSFAASIQQPTGADLETGAAVDDQKDGAEEEDNFGPLFSSIQVDDSTNDCAWCTESTDPVPCHSLRSLVAKLVELRLMFPDSKFIGQEVRIKALMEAAELSPDELDLYCSPSHFNEFTYTRNLVHLNEDFSLMVRDRMKNMSHF
jgi:cysteine dioxygenase